MRDPRKEVPDESIETRLYLKMRLHRFQLNRGLSINEHMNNYMKFLTDLVNVNVLIEEEDKTLILLNSLSEEEYETFILTLINGKLILNYNDMPAALVNYEMRRKDKQSSSNGTLAYALTIRGRGSNRKGKGKRERLKSRPDYRNLKN